MKEFAEYEEWTAKVWNHNLAWEDQVIHSMLGLNSEAGEVADLIKKAWYSPRLDVAKIVDRTALKKELGDVLYYLTRAAALYGISLQDVANCNRQKLEERHGSTKERQE